MLFLSLVFTLTAAYRLFKGKLYYNLQLENAEWEVKVKRGETKEVPKELLTKTGLLGLFALIMLILEIILVVSALKFDPYLYPTISFIVLWFLNFVITRNSASKKDLETESGRVKYLAKTYKKRTLKGFILSVINFTYFTYLFLVLLEVIK